jgi:hypothetical protein
MILQLLNQNVRLMNTAALTKPVCGNVVKIRVLN